MRNAYNPSDSMAVPLCHVLTQASMTDGAENSEESIWLNWIPRHAIRKSTAKWNKRKAIKSCKLCSSHCKLKIKWRMIWSPHLLRMGCRLVVRHQHQQLGCSWTYSSPWAQRNMSDARPCLSILHECGRSWALLIASWGPAFLEDLRHDSGWEWEGGAGEKEEGAPRRGLRCHAIPHRWGHARCHCHALPSLAKLRHRRLRSPGHAAVAVFSLTSEVAPLLSPLYFPSLARPCLRRHPTITACVQCYRGEGSEQLEHGLEARSSDGDAEGPRLLAGHRVTAPERGAALAGRGEVPAAIAPTPSCTPRQIWMLQELVGRLRRRSNRWAAAEVGREVKGERRRHWGVGGERERERCRRSHREESWGVGGCCGGS
jgi:hypothetical protein